MSQGLALGAFILSPNAELSGARIFARLLGQVIRATVKAKGAFAILVREIRTTQSVEHHHFVGAMKQ